jgi:Histidine kinase
MKNKKGQILVHIIGCIAFLSLPVIFSPDFSSTFGFIKVHAFQRSFLTYTFLLLFFYLNYFWLITNLYFEKKYFYFFLCILLCYAVISFVPDFIIPRNHFLPGPPGPGFADGAAGPGHFDFLHAEQPLFQFFIVFILSTMIRINNRWKQSEKEKVNAELSYLKAQINPHFLFNTLNSIYSSAINENADNTASAIVKLSGLMRYVISEAHHTFVSLEKEINYISDYIELQQIRLGNTILLSYEVTGDPAGKKIAPLILISFIENAFKHGVNPEDNSSIRIRIEINGHNLNMTVANRKVKNSTDDTLKNGIGLENTKIRLQLLYPSKHLLEIKEHENEFLVLLKIVLS